MPPRFNDHSWPALVETALFLSGEMGINGTLWARACQVMGREYAAVAVAVISTRPAGHFTSVAFSIVGAVIVGGMAWGRMTLFASPLRANRDSPVSSAKPSLGAADSES